jgi:hypothetical protein
MPTQFLLAGLGHQAEQFVLVGLKEFTILPRDLLGRIRGPHSYQGICRPQACNQLRKKFWVFRHNCRYLVRAANRPSIFTFQEGKDIFSRHVSYSTVTPFKNAIKIHAGGQMPRPLSDPRKNFRLTPTLKANTFVWQSQAWPGNVSGFELQCGTLDATFPLIA